MKNKKNIETSGIYAKKVYHKNQSNQFYVYLQITQIYIQQHASTPKNFIILSDNKNRQVQELLKAINKEEWTCQCTYFACDNFMDKPIST
jgi:hypothetical protein